MGWKFSEIQTAADALGYDLVKRTKPQTDQEQPPFDLAAIEREWEDLVNAYPHAVVEVLEHGVPALVTALKAATQKNTELSGIIVEAAQASPDGLVFAVLEQALKREIEQLRDDNQVLRERLDLATERKRIAELEGSLRERDALLDDVHEWRTEPRTTASSG